MRGFDRPLKPEWIYNFIKTVKIGEKLSDQKKELNSFLWQLDGDVGKRKVRTILTRYFLKTKSNPYSTKSEKNSIIQICKHYPIEAIKPLLLWQLLMRSELLRSLTKLIKEIFGAKQDINYYFLRKKVIDKYGNKEIFARSLRNLLSTLANFDVLKKKNREKILWNDYLEVNDQNLCYMLKLYSEEFIKSPQIILEDIEDYLFIYFKIPDFNLIAKKYNGALWEYSSQFGRNIINFNEFYNWDQDTLDGVFGK